MARTTNSFQFYCRKNKVNKQGLAPLELSITLNGERRFINLPFKFNPNKITKEQREVEDIWRNKINNLLRDMLYNDIPLTTSNLRELIQNGGIKSYTVQNLVDDFLSIYKKRVDVDLTPRSYRKYEMMTELLLKYVSPNKETHQITNSVIQTIYADMNKKYDKTTSAGYMTKLKTLIKFGIDNDKIKINPFNGIKITKGKKPITYLTEEEISKIIDLKTDNISLSNIRDCFVIMLGTGLAYADLSNLKKEDVKKEGDTYYIRKNRVKTGEEFTAIILPFALPFILEKDWKVISNQKFNVYLKVIADLCNIKKNLHSHLGRKTYATLLLQSGVRLETVSKAVGHSGIKITQQYYAKLSYQNVINEVSAIFKEIKRY